MSWEDVEQTVRQRPESDRSVIVTDRPEMHLARELPCAVEYVPADLDETQAAARLAELRKLYEPPVATHDDRPAPAARTGRWALIRAVALPSALLVPASSALLVVGAVRDWQGGPMVAIAVVFAVALTGLLVAGMSIAARLLGITRSTQHYSRLASERTAIMRPAVQRLSDTASEHARRAPDRASVQPPIGVQRLDDRDPAVPPGPADKRDHRTLVIAVGTDFDADTLVDFAGGFDRNGIVIVTDRAGIVAELAPKVSVEYLPEVSERSSGTNLARLLEIAGSCGADEIVVWPDVTDPVDVRSSGVDGISNTESLALSGVASLARRLDGIDRRLGELDELGALGRSVAELGDKISGASTQVDRQMSKRTERSNRELTRYLDSVYQQVEALQRIYRRLDAPRGLPPMRGWAISTDLAAWMVDKVLDGDVRQVLEAGSGSSTCLMAMALEQVGDGHVTALEHDRMYADRTVAMLRLHGVEHRASVVVAPLIDRPVGDEVFPWYDTSSLHLERPVDLLLVDGPPEAVGPHSRFPALPLLAPLMADRATIVLDDGRRDDEAAIAERWARHPDITDVATLPFERRPIELSFERTGRDARRDGDVPPPLPSEDT